MVLAGRIACEYPACAQMFVAEVLQRELLGMDLVHGGAGVGDRTNLIGVELFPPVERGSDIDVHRDHPAELAIHRAGPGQAKHQVEIIGADVRTTLMRC